MNLKYIDAHAHIHSKEFDLDREEVIARMKENEIGCITVGTSLADSKRAVELAEKESIVWATVGVHPTDTKEIFDEEQFAKLMKSRKVMAIGECGLDYYRLTEDKEKAEKERQKENFKKQVEFALKRDLPLMIHCRPSGNSMDAHEDMISILSSYLIPHNSSPAKTFSEKFPAGKLRGNVHFFTGSSEIAQKYFDLGFTVSLSGVITFAKELEEMAKSLPLERVLVETDCPYASPIPNRGKRNEPIFVVQTVKHLSSLRQEPLELISEALLNNTQKLFKMDIA